MCRVYALKTNKNPVQYGVGYLLRAALDLCYEEHEVKEEKINTFIFLRPPINAEYYSCVAKLK